MKVRLYTKTINKWVDEGGMLIQKEVGYREYRVDDNTLFCSGSEDFSPERYSREIAHGWVWIWDGCSRNKGGYKRWEEVRHINFRKTERKAVMTLLKAFYPDASEIQIRSSQI